MSEFNIRAAQVAELLCDGHCSVVQTLSSCRQLVSLCRAVDIGAAPEGAEMGMYRVLGLVDDALEHLEGEVRVLMGLPRDEDAVHGREHADTTRAEAEDTDAEDAS